MDDTTTQTRPASPAFPNPVRLVYTALGYGVVLSTALAFWLVERVWVGVPFIVAAAGLAGYENRQPVDSHPPPRRPPPPVPALLNRLAAAYLGGEAVGDRRLRCRVLALGCG